jgi:hypothetical protein
MNVASDHFYTFLFYAVQYVPHVLQMDRPLDLFNKVSPRHIQCFMTANFCLGISRTVVML